MNVSQGELREDVLKKFRDEETPNERTHPWTQYKQARARAHVFLFFYYTVPCTLHHYTVQSGQLYFINDLKIIW